jgi:hypothetical protein
MSAERSTSQTSIHDASFKTAGNRPNTSYDNYGIASSSKHTNTLKQTAGGRKNYSTNGRVSLNLRKFNSSHLDRVRNYKSKAFRDSQPVYGTIDAFNRQVLKHVHEEVGSSGFKSKHIAVRPQSKHDGSSSPGRQTLYPSLMKKPRERVKEEVKQMIVFRRTFGSSFK